jgi:hypothetical protein
MIASVTACVSRMLIPKSKSHCFCCKYIYSHNFEFIEGINHPEGAEILEFPSVVFLSFYDRHTIGF